MPADVLPPRPGRQGTWDSGGPARSGIERAATLWQACPRRMPDTQPLSFRRRATILVLLVGGAGQLAALVFPAAILPFAGSALIAYLVRPGPRRLTGQRVFGRVIRRCGGDPAHLRDLLPPHLPLLIAIVPQLYREVVRISSNAFAFARSLTPERVQENGPRDGGLA